MSQEKIKMRKVRDTFRLHLECGLTNREIGRAINISNSTVGHYIKALNESGLNWSDIKALDDDALLQRIIPFCKQLRKKTKETVVIDYIKVHQELKKKGVTREILWEELRDSSKLPIVSYTQFCLRYRQFLKQQKPSMRQIHKAGDLQFFSRYSFWGWLRTLERWA